MTPERFAKINQVLNKRQPDMAIVTDFVHKSRNLSAVVRSADAVGIQTIHAALSEQEFYAFHGTAKGSHQWVDVHRHDTIDQALTPIIENNMAVIAADVTDNCIDYRAFDYTKPFALLLGAEKKGVSQEAKAKVSQFVRIPMVGMVESFNVSVAAGIILSEAFAQRQKAGFYQKPRLAKHLRQRLLFEWGQPKVRDFCQARGLAYPPLDEQGEIIDAPAWYQSVKSPKRNNK